MSGGNVEDWDHDSVPSQSWAYRRVAKVPNVLIYNREFARWQLTPEAFVYDDVPRFDFHERGVSVSSSEVAARESVPLSDIIGDWTTHGLAFFEVSVIREVDGMGIVEDSQPDNQAHALIRSRETSKTERNKLWKPLRGKLVQVATYVAESDDLLGYPDAPSPSIG